jgi:hypothetical protein
MLDLTPLFHVPKNVETRWTSPENPTGERGAGGQKNAGRKGAACFELKPGMSRTLAEVTGSSGVVRRIWMTIFQRTPLMLRGIRIDIYWDGTDTPAVSAPLGDFFGHGLGRMSVFESALFSSPEGRSFNCYIPMPFKTSMRIVLTNETEQDQTMVFYDVNYTLGDTFGLDDCYFHACFRRENPTTIQEDFVLLPLVHGRGRYLGTLISMIANTDEYYRAWWGEGEVKIYLDGDTDLPTLCGTGTEDYIGSGWAQGHYTNLHQGCTVADHEAMRFAFYRYHIPDPVYFNRDITVTIQQLGTWDPEVRPMLHFMGAKILKAGEHPEPADLSADGDPQSNGLFERRDDWACCSYVYINKPEACLPELPSLEERIANC